MRGAFHQLYPHNLTSVEAQSCLERQVVLNMFHTNFLEVHLILLKLYKENTGLRTFRTFLF